MKLADWLKKEGVKRTDFAARIDVSPSYITALCDDTVWPGKDVAGRIAAATNNEVEPNDFMVPARPAASSGEAA